MPSSPHWAQEVRRGVCLGRGVGKGTFGKSYWKEPLRGTIPYLRYGVREGTIPYLEYGVKKGTNGFGWVVDFWWFSCEFVCVGKTLGKLYLIVKELERIVGTSWEKVLKQCKINRNTPKQQKTRGKTILDNQGVRTICEKTKKSVGKLWENYNWLSGFYEGFWELRGKKFFEGGRVI